QPWIGQELRAIRCQRRGAHHWIRLEHAVNNGVICCPALRLVPAVRRLTAESRPQFEARRYLPGILDKPRGLERAPAQFRRRWHDREGGDRALQERLQRAERRLPVLILRQHVI